MADVTLPSNLKSLEQGCLCYVDSVYESHGFKCARIWPYLSDNPSFVRVADSEFDKLKSLTGASATVRIGIRFGRDLDGKTTHKWWVLEVL